MGFGRNEQQDEECLHLCIQKARTKKYSDSEQQDEGQGKVTIFAFEVEYRQGSTFTSSSLVFNCKGAY